MNNTVERPKGIYLLPNIFTTGNLFAGFYSIIASVNGEYEKAAVAILFGAFFDSVDGKIARWTRTTSKFGVEYDSLSDLVSFGMAPAILSFLWALKPFGRIGWLAAFIFMVGGAFRLARFNVITDVVDKKYFVGLPIPAAAGVIATSVLAYHHFFGYSESDKPFWFVVVVLGIAFLMVSNIRYYSFKDIDLIKRRPFKILLFLVLGALVIAADPESVLFLMSVVYALSGVVEGIRHRKSVDVLDIDDEDVVKED
ncbi:MAG: CDP-diacylglycerol--serine O-phosphatidyltransferase [bacterium]